MQPEIDFLPASYREQLQVRRRRIWRRLVLLLFIGLIIAGIVQQRRRSSELIALRDRLARQYANMTAALDDAEQLRGQLERMTAQANLVAKLSERTPPSQLLAAVTNARPKYVRLTRIETTIEELNTSDPVKRIRDPEVKRDAADELPERADLARLREAAKRSRLFVSVSGVAPTDLVISQYVAELARAGLFDDVRMGAIVETDFRGHPLRSFSIRMRVRS